MYFINYPSLFLFLSSLSFPHFLYFTSYIHLPTSFFLFSIFIFSTLSYFTFPIFFHIFFLFVHPLSILHPLITNLHSLKFIIFSQFKPTKISLFPFAIHPIPISLPNFFHLDTLFIIALPSPFIFTTSLSSSILLRYFHVRHILPIRPSISPFATLHSCLANTLLVAR